MFARAPRGTDAPLDLTGAGVQHFRVDGSASGRHLFVEDPRGVRWADLHAGRAQALDVVLPRGRRPLFVRSPGDGEESSVEELIAGGDPGRNPDRVTPVLRGRAGQLGLTSTDERVAAAVAGAGGTG